MVELNETRLNEYRDFANELADLARQIIVPYFRDHLTVDNKPTSSPSGQPVTEADLETEAAMRKMISKHYPYHGIIGEEFAPTNPDSDLCWVLDPIDGTKAFIAGLPMFGTLIGLGLKGNPILGVLEQPILQDRFIGTKGGTFLNGVAINTRKCPNLMDAVYSMTDPRMMSGDIQQGILQKLMKAARITQFGGNCYAYGMLASGSIDLITENDLMPWDIFALIPIIEGAGGVVTSWSGDATKTASHVIACGDQQLHTEVLKLLRTAI